MLLVLAKFDPREIQEFKRFTREKLRGVRCPRHRQPPRLRFSGRSLSEITISMTGCCNELMQIANARIAQDAAGVTPLR